MKLLFDANLSPSLVGRMSDLFPDSAHVEDFGELMAEDRDIREFALRNGYTIVTKDADFNEMNQVANSGPKIVWIRKGNCSTSVIEQMIRAKFERIKAMQDEQTDFSVLILY